MMFPPCYPMSGHGSISPSATEVNTNPTKNRLVLVLTDRAGGPTYYARPCPDSSHDPEVTTSESKSSASCHSADPRRLLPRVVDRAFRDDGTSREVPETCGLGIREPREPPPRSRREMPCSLASPEWAVGWDKRSAVPPIPFPCCLVVSPMVGLRCACPTLPSLHAIHGSMALTPTRPTSRPSTTSGTSSELPKVQCWR